MRISNTRRLSALLRGALALPFLAIVTLAWPAGNDVGAYIAHTDAPRVPGQIVVRFREGVSADQRAALLAMNGATGAGESSPGYTVVNVPEDRRESAARALASSRLVATAEDITIREPAGGVPNDPYYSLQWNFDMIGYEDAHEQSTGAGVLVAVLDTGIAYEDCAYSPACDNPFGSDFAQAPDLGDTNFNLPREVFTDATIHPQPDDDANDDYGHGTHVAGTIAQSTNNGIGAAGIAPDATIMPVKICGWLDPTPLEVPPDAVQDYGCPSTSIAAGITYAVDNGARIINMSIGGGAGSITQAEKTALQYAQDAGVLVVAAAGNGGADKKGDPVLDYPAAVETVVAVGAVGILGNRAAYSNYGVGEGNHNMDFVAPGGDPLNEGSFSVISQQSYSTCLKATEYTQFSPVTSCTGTSMAAAHVTGIAALVRSKFQNLGLQQVRDALACSTVDLGAPGFDLQYGNGLLRADLAVRDIDNDLVPDCIDPVTVTPSPSPTPPANYCLAPSVTPLPSPSPSPTPTETPSATPTASPSPTETPSPTPTGSPTPAPTDSGSPTPSDSGLPTDTPAPTGTSLPTDTPQPTESPLPTDTPTATPSPTPSASPTPSPSPTPVPPGCGDVDCSGAVNGLDALGVLYWMAGSSPEPACIELGYASCDAALNAADVVTILRYAATLLQALPDGCPDE